MVFLEIAGSGTDPNRRIRCGQSELSPALGLRRKPAPSVKIGLASAHPRLDTKKKCAAK